MKIKNISYKIIAVIIASIMLLLTINFNVFAITSGDKGTINITGLEDGVTVTLYKIADVVWDDDANQPKEPVIKWVEPVKTYLSGQNGQDKGYSQYADDTRTFSKNITSNSNEAEAFYDFLASKIKSGEIVVSPTNTSESIQNESLNITNVEMGTYLILVEGGDRVYQAAVANVAPEYTEGQGWQIKSNEVDVSVNVKSSEINITKTITNKALEEDSTFNTGDTIEYQIIAGVPKYLENNLAKDYLISDTFSSGLTLVDGSIKVYGLDGNNGEGTLLNVQQDYSILETQERPEDLRGAAFVLNFEYAKIQNYKNIKVTYSATLNDDSSITIADSGNKNTATLNYSNNPYASTDETHTKESETTVYTYKVDVKKVIKGQESTGLAGAKFEVYNEKGGKADSTPIEFVTTEDGVYYASSDESGTTTTLEVDENGDLTINGLKNGKYYLREVEAPAGYVKLSEDTTFTINNANVSEIKVENSNGFVLPLTGGIGTTIFVAVGSVVIGLGVLLIIFILRKKNNNTQK